MKTTYIMVNMINVIGIFANLYYVVTEHSMINLFVMLFGIGVALHGLYVYMKYVRHY